MNPRTERYLLLLLLALLPTHLLAAPLETFSHDYMICRGETRVGKATMRLYPQYDYWIWEMRTEPVGWLRFLTRKKPFSETWLRLRDGEPALMLTRSGDYDDKPADRSTWFDDRKQRLYYANRKGTRQLDYRLPLHDILSIHLLYPRLLESPDGTLETDFYKKGKIRRTTLRLERDVPLRSGDDTLILDRVTQTLEGSDKQMVYYYRRGDIAPIKIEQYKGKTEKSVMWRMD